MSGKREIACGVDVHNKFIVATILSSDGLKLQDRFDPDLDALLKFKYWLKENGCHKVALESTGNYSLPIYNVLDSDPLNQIPDNSLDKIIMINAFQDVNPYSTLKTFHRIISPKGFFRVNVLSREFRDENIHDKEHFNKGTGYSYLTRSPSADVKPLGYFTDKRGDQIPYYRILESYYRRDLDRILQECGFDALS